LAINAFTRKALENRVLFNFNEQINTLLVEKGRVVDLRPGPGSKNYYFYQNIHGQVVFRITPDPPILGTDTRETSVFLPQVAARMVALIPRLKPLRVRRVWRGCYQMSPDGSPVVGWSPEIKGLLHITGMCGQGFMLGPGMGELAARMITGSASLDDKAAITIFSPARSFSEGREALT
jgi:sarcosine oxidase subunit beta